MSSIEYTSHVYIFISLYLKIWTFEYVYIEEEDSQILFIANLRFKSHKINKKCFSRRICDKRIIYKRVYKYQECAILTTIFTCLNVTYWI